MRVLLAPMAAMAETSGPFSRSAALCGKLLELQHEVALCCAEDVNYQKLDNAINFYAPVPSPMGLPMSIGKRMFKAAQMLGVQQKRKVNSFEQVLHIVGATDKKHFESDVGCIRKAIQEFKPDIVYSEFRLAAIVAAKMEGIKVVTGYSYPVRKSYASNPEFSKGVRAFLKANSLPDIESVLEIFHWADLKLVPSSYELEPIEEENTVFTGPFSIPAKKPAPIKKNKIVAYMGNGAITAKNLVNVLTKAFDGSRYEVYVATEQVRPSKKGNIIIDKRFDFGELLPGAVAHIHHGGQNSVMTGLMHGVPQILCAGNVFERIYNASCVTRLKAGVSIETRDFTAEMIQSTVSEFENNPCYTENSKNAGEALRNLGGVGKAVRALESIIEEVVL